MVAPNTIGTPFFGTGANSEASPHVYAIGNLTIGASDTAAYVLVCYAAQGSASTSCAAAVTLGGITMTAVSGTKIAGFGGVDGDGFTELFELRNPASSPGTGAQAVSASISFTSAPGGSRCIAFPMTVTGALGTTTGGHAASVNGASSISTGSQNIGSASGLLLAIGANGSTAPTVATGTSQATKTGDGNTGSDNATIATNTGAASVTVTFTTNAADESQCSFITITAAAAGTAKRPPQTLVAPPAAIARASW